VSTDPAAVLKPTATFQITPGFDFIVFTYTFISQEIPGGFFGTQFNDFFEVSITDAVDEVSHSDSILGLEEIAFNDDGVTSKYRLSFNIKNKVGQLVTVAAGVANAVDQNFQSAVCGDVTFE
jgi:hypothetical protein